MNIRLFIVLLLAFFRPGIEGDSGGQEDLQLDLDDGNGEDGGDQQDKNDGEDDNGADGADRIDHAKLYADEKAGREADRARADKFERELAELRAGQNRQPDPVVAEEDRKLNDPNVTDLEKWQIKANRELRAGRNDSQNALAQARDIDDRTKFSKLESQNPVLFKRYEARVEEEFQKTRAAGNMVPRAAILSLMVGSDMLQGKLTKKAAPEKKPGAGVNRGRLPGARSDTTGKSGKSEHEKLRARLEGVQI